MTEQEEPGEATLSSAVGGRVFTGAGVQLRTSSDLLEDFQNTIDVIEMEYLRGMGRIRGGETPAKSVPSGSRALDMTS
ncbi:hypothetical protein [Streptomyces sp. NPDC088766]|uniref:hypothetical protein n=1 Tax=Streptomyces sp. NPDC088766 TaxID=3365893 RepID=UPI003817E25D